MVILRILHIFSGVFVGGYYLFMIPILTPRLKRLGPTIQGPVMQALLPVLTPVMFVSVIVIVGTGIAMALIQQHGNVSSFFASGWGWAMLIGFVLTLAAIVVAYGFMMPTSLRMQKLGRSIQGRPPSPAEAKQMGQFGARIEALSYVNFILIVIILLSMTIARYL